VPDDFVLVMNEAISRFSKELKKPEQNYTFFIDYLLNAISKHNKGSVSLINTRISKFLCTFVKHSKDNHEVLLLTKFLTPTYYGTVDCVKFYLEVRKLVFQIFNDGSSRTQKLRGLDVEISRCQVLCSAMKISFTKTCQILGFDPKKYKKKIPVVNLILVMLELNFNNNKDSFELKKKKLQVEYEKKVKKSGITQAPQWKKPPYMMQLMQSVSEYEVINRKVLFL
jgi:hypothetical protein